MAKEIEKKYRLQTLPGALVQGWTGASVVRNEISQGYLVTEPGELRVRRRGDRHFMTVKGDGTLSRDEWEQEIPKWVFETLWPKTEGARVEKIRYSIPHEGLTLEADEYRGALAGLFTLEVEFSSEEEARAFELPFWATFAKDVTDDKRYKNKALAVHGLPRD